MTLRQLSRKRLRAAAVPHGGRPLGVQQLEDRVNPAPIQFFFIPMPESHTNAAFDDFVTQTVDSTQVSITAITVTESNTRIWYDHWEDGYEANLGNPRQATTQIWGDGDDTNGIAPGFANDPLGLPSGTVLRLRNDVSTPRDTTAQPILFDSPDRFGSDRKLAVSRVQFPTLVNGAGGSVISSAVEVRDTRYYDTHYTAPVGVNTPAATRSGQNSMFSHTAFFVQAYLDNTRVRIDANADGDFTDPDDRDVILNQGETVVSGPNVRHGGRVVADKPVQTNLLTGQVNGVYASRTYSLFSNAQTANDYFTPVGFGGPGDTSDEDDVRLYVYNPNPAPINVSQEANTGVVTTKTVPAGGSAFFDVLTNTGTRLFSTGGERFQALGVHDGPGGTTATTHDWGFSLQPVNALSQIAIVGLGVGNSNDPPAGSGNFSPVFVTALGATTLHVDHDNDGVVDQTIPLARLQSVRLRDTTRGDDDNSGMRIFTLDGTLISVAWGEDGTAPSGSPGLDAGTTIPAIAVPEFYKFSTFAPGGDVNGDGLFNEGDTIRYSLRIRHIGTQPISNAIVTDALPTAQVTYVAGSTSIDDGTTTTGIPDSGPGTAFPLDGSGFTVTSISPGQTLVVSFDAVINSGLPVGFNFILNQSVLAYDIFELPASDVIDLRGTVGDRVWYDVNGDGVQDAGEPGIAGATVTLTWAGPDGVAGNGDDDTFTATTGVNGIWSLTNLPTGNYTTAVSNLPNGLTAQTFGLASFNLPAGQIDRTDIDFGYRGTGSIGNFVWDDRNVNGIQDVGENGLAGATVGLTWAGFNGTFGDADDVSYPAVTTTTGSSNYGFAHLPSGHFRASVTPPAGGTRSPQDQGGNDNLDSDFHPGTGLTGTIALAAGASDQTIDAGLVMRADLAVVKSDGGVSTTPGGQVTYTITVTNNGPVASGPITLVDTVPANTSFVTASGGGSLSGGVVTWTLASLASGVSTAVTITLQVASTVPAGLTQISNSASASGPFVDPTPGNNTGTDTTPLIAAPDLVIVKDDGLTTVSPGGIVTYTITVSNVGNQGATGVVLSESVPAHATFIPAGSSPGWNSAGTTLTIGSLAAGATVTFMYRVQLNSSVPAGVTQFTNTATVADDGGNGPDPTPGNNTSTDTNTLAAAPDLRVVKTDGGVNTVPGGLVTYTITVFNDGNQDATGVMLSETVPANTTFVAVGSSGGWNPAGTSFAVGGLAAGASVTITYQVRVNDPFPAGSASISNTVTVADDGANGPDPTPGNNSATDPTPVFNGRIGDRVFLDRNGNGIQDSGEVGVPGITVRLLNANTLAVLDTVTTGPNGDYRFINLPAGNYKIAFGTTDGTRTFAFSAARQGGNDTTDSDPAADGVTPTITLASGQQTADIDAGVYVPVSIGDTVFFDADGSGTQNGEPGIAGVSVRLFYAGPDGVFGTGDMAAPVRTTVTGANGLYSFTGLAPGAYRVVVDPSQSVLAALGMTAPTTGTTQPTTLLSGQTDLARDFGFTGTGSLGDRVWLDRNRDGVQTADEPGLTGLPVSITWLGFDGVAGGGDDVSYPAVLTGANGVYTRANLPRGKFRVSVDTIGSNLVPTFDPDTGTVGANGTAIIELTAAAPSTTAADFGFRGTASIGDLVFQDIDRDGVFDAGRERGIPGATVTARWAGADGQLDTADDFTFTTTTDANGVYRFNALPVFGTGDPYRVTVTPPAAGYTPTGDLDGVATPNAATLVLGPGDRRADVDFGLGGAPGQSIAGRVYHDLNNNGTRDAGEPGIAGVTVRLTGTDAFGRSIVNPATGQTFFDVTTGADGSYRFDALVPGTYAVSEPIQPAAYTDGTDTAGSLGGTAGNDIITGIVVAAGSVGSGYDFGERGVAVAGTVFRDDDRDGIRDLNEPGIAGVTIELRDTVGNPVTDPMTGQPFRVVTGADGAYLFPNVPVGRYRIVETQPTGYANGPVGPATVRTVTVPAAGLNGQDFAEVLGRIGGTVYVDRNANATRDAGESGPAGVTVTLTGTDVLGNPVRRTATTDANGRYVFDNVFPANAAGYTLTEGPVPTLNDGPANAPGTAGGTAAGPNRFTRVAPAAGARAGGYDFGEVGTTVGGTVFLDADRDGRRSTGETPLPGVVVQLVNAGGAVVGTATTGPDGRYLFTNVLPGMYTVRELQPVGYGNPSGGPSAPDRRPITVTNAPVSGIDFVDTLGSLSGIVYLDANGNGTRDAGEVGLGGVVVALSGTDAVGNSVTRATTTAADGRYRFDNVPAGTYALTETQPTAIADGADTAGTIGGRTMGTVGNDVVSGIRLPAGGDYVDQQFGELPPPNPVLGTTFVSGTVFRDTNGNGVADVGEPGLSGVVIELRDSTGAVVRTATTRADGSYLFLAVAPGTYSVVQPIQPAGLGSTSPDRLPISVGADLTPVTNVNFGEAAGTVSGRVYLDSNGNGRPDVGEPGLAGVPIRLTGRDANDDRVSRSTSTAADGSFAFTDLPPSGPDGYTVRETQPTGLLDGADTAGESGGTAGNDVITGIPLPVGGVASGIAFGERSPSRPGFTFLSGTVFLDADRDGQQDAGEAPFKDVVLELLAADGVTVLATTRTGPDGRYVFPNLRPGVYAVRETQPVGPGSTTPNLLPVSIASTADQRTDVAFGEVFGSLTGSVFADADRDGVRDPGEFGIGRVTVTLTGTDAGGNRIRRTATTDAEGNYRFNGLPTGNFTLTETQPAGYADGADAAGTAGGTPTGGDAIARIALAAGQMAAGYTFGEIGTNTVSGMVYADNNRNGVFDPRNGDTGFAAGILILLTGTDANGNLFTRSTRTAGDGGYRFEGVPAGSYRIIEDQPNLPTTALPPDGVYDGADNVGSAGGSVAEKNQLALTLTGDGANPAQDASGYNFGELPPAAPFGTAFVDANANGRLDAGERLLAGVAITIRGTAFAGTPGARPLTPADLPNGLTVTTDANGRYLFDNLPSGVYTIALGTGPDGLTLFRLENADRTGPALTIDETAFTNVAQDSRANRGGFNFGFVAPASVDGAVYLDANGNGTRDAGEAGLPGVPVRLTGTDGLGNAVDRTIVTGADGTYRFADLLPGEYVLTETQPTGLNQGETAVGTAGGSLVATDTVGGVTLLSGTTASGYLFGEREPVVPVVPPAVPLPQPVPPLPPLTPLTTVAPPADPTKRQFLGSTTSDVSPPAQETGRTVPDFAALNSPSATRDPVFVVTAEGEGGELVRVFDLTGGQERFRFRPFPGNVGGVRAAAADITGDGIPDIIAVAGPGGPPRVIAYDGNNGAVLFDFLAFEASFAGGLYVATGDLNGDGRADVVVTPDVGGGPRAKILSSGDPEQVLADFFAIEDPDFRGGVRPAVGDLNGDGTADLAVGAGVGGGPRVAVWDGRAVVNGRPARLWNDFFAFESGLRNGVFLSVGDIDGNGTADLIAGAGPGGAPRVVGFSAESLLSNQPPVVASFFAGNTADRGGVPVLAVDVDGDGRTEVLTGAGSGSRPMARFIDPRTGSTLDEFAAEYMEFVGGVMVG